MVQLGGDILDEYSALYNTLLVYVRLCDDGVARGRRLRQVFCLI